MSSSSYQLKGKLLLTSSFIEKINSKNISKQLLIDKYNISSIIDNIYKIIKMNGSLGFLRKYKYNTEEDCNILIAIEKSMKDIEEFISDPNHTLIRKNYLEYNAKQREIGLIFLGMFSISFNEISSVNDSYISSCSKYSIYSLMIFIIKLYEIYEIYIQLLEDPSKEKGGIIVNPVNNYQIDVNSVLFHENKIRFLPLIQYDFPDDKNTIDNRYNILRLDDMIRCILTGENSLKTNFTINRECTTSLTNYFLEVGKEQIAKYSSSYNFSKKYLKYKNKYLMLKNKL